MRTSPTNSHFGRFVRDHERSLVIVSVIGLLVFGAVVAVSVVVARIRMPVLAGVEQIVDYWDNRWTRRLESGERLVNAKQYSEAVEYLAALDSEFPARNVKHKRDMERERLLRALGRSYSEMGKKRLALDTYRRLIEFDPRNFENHYLLAQACLRFGEPDMAEGHLARVLKIHPTHPPSVRARLTSQFAKGDFAAVIAAYETYLNAFLIQQVTVALGQSSTTVNVPVDGRFHNVDLRLAHPPEASGELVFRVGQFAIEINTVTIQAPLLVGEPGVTITPLWPSEISWRVQEMAPIGAGSFRALGPGAALRLDVPPQPNGVATIRFRLRLFKPFDMDLWDMVNKSYKNLLRYNDLKAAQERSVISIMNGGAP